jgi:hypothetical protein
VARTAATVEDLEAGNLPSVCAKTGEPADGYVSIEFTSTPGWTWILLLFGIVPFLIAQYFSRLRVVGILPMSDVALRRARSYRWIYRGLFAVGVALFGIGLAMQASAVALSGLAALVGALLFAAVGRPFVWPSGRLSGEWVWLSFVHARFADEVDRWYGR